MADQAAPLDPRQVLTGLLQLAYKKTHTITDPKDIDLLAGLIRQTLKATGARTRRVELDTTLENAARAAERPNPTDPVVIKTLGIVDHVLRPTEKLRAAAHGECPGILGVIVATEEDFVLLPDGEGLIMVIFPKADTEG